MDIQQQKIIVERTARYFVAGRLSGRTRTLVIAIHGFAQLAPYFIRSFERIVRDDLAVVAPEGLSRFYLEKFSGRVVASWMTREDRLDEISDYCAYLDKVLEQVRRDAPDARLVVLGFSQGTATAVRWLERSSALADRLILWGGGMPEDISDYSRFSDMEVNLVWGNEDQFISRQQMDAEMSRLQGLGVRATLTEYAGKHLVDPETLLKLNL